MMLDINKKQSSRDWDNIIEDKKKELYAHLYKLDKKLLTFDQSY